MGRRGGLRGAAAESAAIRGQAGGAAERHRRARADRRRRGRLRILDQALRLRERVPSLRSLLRVAPMDEPASARPALPEGALDFNAARPPCRPTGWPAASHPGQRRGRLFPYGRHHRRAQAGHPHARQPGLHRLGRGAAAKRRPRRCGHQRLSAVPRGRRPARLAPRCRPASPPSSPTQLLRNREVLRNYWRLVERHRATSLQGVPTILAALAEVPLDGADFLAALLPHWRRAAAGRTGRALRAAIRPARQRKPGHDRNGRHLVHQPTWLGFSGQLRGLSAALCTGAHRHAGRRPRQAGARPAARRGRHGAVRAPT